MNLNTVLAAVEGGNAGVIAASGAVPLPSVATSSTAGRSQPSCEPMGAPTNCPRIRSAAGADA